MNIPTNQYLEINNKSDLLNASQSMGNALILKKRTLGYDGKGQLRISKQTNFDLITDEQCHNCIAEEIVPFIREVSLIAARNQHGKSVFYDICENTHKNGVLFKTYNRINDSSFELAQTYMEKILHALDYIGVLGIEFFQVKNRLIANEMAPRVHNSGHWTLDASITSQFENHLRCIANLPLGDTSSTVPSIMYNLLQQMPDKNKLLAFPALKFHDYCKEPAVGRKLGHVTFLNLPLPLVLSELEQLLAIS